MTHQITKNGWLVFGPHRIKLAVVERYEKRDGKVVLQSAEWGCIIDCDPDPSYMANALTVAGADPVKREKAVKDKTAHAEEAHFTAKAIVEAIDAYFAK